MRAQTHEELQNRGDDEFWLFRGDAMTAAAGDHQFAVTRLGRKLRLRVLPKWLDGGVFVRASSGQIADALMPDDHERESGTEPGRRAELCGTLRKRFGCGSFSTTQ